MNRRDRNRNVAVFLCGSLVSAFFYAVMVPAGSNARFASAQGPQSTDTAALATLQQDVELLKGKAPGQAHAMMDVDYHYTNLWFAAKSENWPLAEFYWNETVSHMHWAVRIIPVRKDNAGQDIKLNDILQSIEQSPFMQVGSAIQAKNSAAFETAYRSVLEGCYSCHKAADKPYLRLQMPERPATRIVNFDPEASWPK